VESFLPFARQEEEVSIARSQPLQSQTLAIDPKPSIPQNSPRQEGILTLNLSDVDGLDFWFHKRPSSRDNSSPCNNGSLRECPSSCYEEVEDDISNEGELNHIEDSICSPSMFTNSKSILDLRDPSYLSLFSLMTILAIYQDDQTIGVIKTMRMACQVMS